MKKTIIKILLIILVFTGGFQAKIAQAVLSDNILAYYKFDSGALTTDSVASYTLTNNNTVGETASGLIGYSADFGSGANTTKWFNVNNNFGLNASTAESYSFWFYCQREGTSGSTVQGIMSHRIYNTTQKAIIVGYDYSTTHKLRLAGYGNTGVSYEYDMGAFSTWGNKWNHVVVTYNGDTLLKIYFNGSYLSAINPTGSWGGGSPSSHLDIGTNNVEWGTTNNFSGRIDEFGVWSRELSSTEVTQLYNSGAGLQYPFTTTTATTQANILIFE